MPNRSLSSAIRLTLLTICLIVVLLGCEPSGDRLAVTPLSSPSVQVEQQAIKNLVDLYRQAVLQEDIDRFESLLQPPATPLSNPRQSRSAIDSLSSLRDTLRSTFQRHALSGLSIPADSVVIADDLSSVRFIEIEHLIEPSRFIQQSRVYQTRFDLSRTVSGDTVSFRLAGVSREGPLVTITTPGQVQVDGIARLGVHDPQGLFPLRTPDGKASASTRLIAAGPRDIWLHGSDGGIARVADTLPAGACPDNGVGVTYDPIMRRQDGLIPSNTVPALLAPSDDTLWVGSALGLALLQNGVTTPVPFGATQSFQGNPETLESFFHQIAQAIFAAQPIASVALGEVSFGIHGGGGCQPATRRCDVQPVADPDVAQLRSIAGGPPAGAHAL